MKSILKKEIITNRALSRGLASIFFIMAITLSAFVRIPLLFTPVPLTLQTFFVLLSAAFLGIRLGLFTQLSYIFLGIIGFPIFTGATAGLAYLYGATAGYLLGFVAASLIIASLMKYAKGSLPLIIAIFFFADFVLLACGSLWLKVSLHISFVQSLYIGFFPFLPGDILKAALAALLFFYLKPRINEVL
jgi:biotin transport system substrate-specific component